MSEDKFVPLKGTLTGRLRRDPNHQYGVDWQDRISSGDVDTGIKLDWAIDYAEIETRMLAQLGATPEQVRANMVHDEFTVEIKE